MKKGRKGMMTHEEKRLMGEKVGWLLVFLMTLSLTLPRILGHKEGG